MVRRWSEKKIDRKIEFEIVSELCRRILSTIVHQLLFRKLLLQIIGGNEHSTDWNEEEMWTTDEEYE